MKAKALKKVTSVLIATVLVLTLTPLTADAETGQPQSIPDSAELTSEVRIDAYGLGYGEGGYAYEPPAGTPIANVFNLIDTYVDSDYENVAIVTFDEQNQFGAMWSKETLNLMRPFKTEMDLHLGHEAGNDNSQVADGMTFTMHNNAAALDAMVGGRGEGLGVFQGRKSTGFTGTEVDGIYLDHSLVIEFDTYWNGGDSYSRVKDPGVRGNAHCALVIPRGNFIDVGDHENVIYFTPTQDWIRFELEWIPEISGGTLGGTLKYSFGGSAMTYHIADVEEIFGGTEVYWGFTGATGGQTALQAAAITKLPTQEFFAVKTVENSDGDSVDGGIAVVGDTLSYTITVTAEKAIAGIGPVAVTDELSPYVRYNGGDITVTTSDIENLTFEITPTFEGNTMTVETGHVLRNVGDWLSITFDVEVLETGRGQVVQNAAVAYADKLMEPQASNTTEVTVINTSRKIVAEDSAAGANGAAVKPGDEVTFKIEYVNNTGYTAELTITDEVPAGMEYVGSSNSGAYDGDENKVVWDIGSLEAGEGGEVTVTMRMVSVNGPTITNKANLSWDTVGGTAVEEPEVILPVVSYKLVDAGSGAGVDGETVTADDLVTYKIVYINGAGKTADLTITDEIPADMEYVSSDGVYDDTANKVVWQLDGLAAGAFGEVTVTMRVADDAGPTVINKAELSWDTGGDDPIEEAPEVVNPVMPYKIVAEDSAAGVNGATVKMGDEVTFKIAYANQTGVAAELTITDEVPAGMEYVGSDGTYDEGENKVVWDIGRLEAGDDGEVTVTMRVISVDIPVIANKAKLSWDTADGTAVEEPEVNVPVGSYKIVDAGSEAGVDGETVTAGDVVTYKIVYINSAGKTADLTITDRIPAGMEYVSSDGVYDDTANKVIWQLDGLAAGAFGEVTVTMRVAADAGSTVINKAELSWDTGGDDPIEEAPEVVNPVIPYKIVAEDSEAGANGAAVKVGDEVTFKIAYANQTGGAAELTITDEVPAGMEYVDSSHSGAYDEDENKVVWDIGSLEAGDDGEVTVTMRVISVDLLVIINTAKLEWDTGNGTQVEEPEVILPVGSYKIVDADSDAGADGEAVAVGDEVTYKLIYVNTTGETADLIMIDEVPEEMEYVSSDGTFIEGDNIVVWEFNGLEPGESGEGTVTMGVISNADPVIINKANLLWFADPSSLLLEEEPEVDVPVGSYKIVDADSEAGVDGAAVVVGDKVTYKITYVNNTGSTADLTITDEILVGMEYVSSGGIYDQGGNKVVWSFDGIEAGASGSVTVTMRVTSDAGPFITNKATLEWDAEGGPAVEEPQVENPVGAHKVTYKANGGTGSDFIDLAELGETYNVRALNTTGINRTGYRFTGWNTKADGSGTSYSQDDTITIIGNVVLYAQWYRDGGGGGGSSPDDDVPDVPILDTVNHFAYVIGYPDGMVGPGDNITRAEVATIFLRLMTQEYRAENWAVTNSYPDVTADAWYNNAISTLTNINVLKGCPDGSFKPTAYITRAELAALAVRFAGNEKGGENGSFSDIAGHWAEDDILRASALGYASGYPDGTFRPDTYITRAEVVTLVNNVLNRHVEASDDLLADMVTWPDNISGKWYYFALQEATNSHYYDRKADGEYERWTEMRLAPDWKRLEVPGASPYDVVY